LREPCDRGIVNACWDSVFTGLAARRLSVGQSAWVNPPVPDTGVAGEETLMRNGKHVILTVDDDQDVIDGVAMVLEANGYIVESATSGKAGLAKYKECNPDFVLVDMMMESVGAGMDLAAALKKLGKKPVYMLSSMSDGLNQIADPSSQGLDGTLQKPLDPDLLLEIVRSRLA
jgi:CheY-like chemotaxis protein